MATPSGPPEFPLDPKTNSNVPSDGVDEQVERMRIDEKSDASDRELVSLVYKSESIVQAFADRWPGRRELEEMSRSFGPELVRVALARILAQVTPNRYFYEQVEAILRDSPDLRPSSILWLNRREPPVLSPKDLVNRYELCIVSSVAPSQLGRDWGSHVNDWKHWARLSGMTTSVIETRKSQSLLSNSEIIRRFLRENPHDRRIIATLGQGSTEFRMLIDQLAKLDPIAKLGPMKDRQEFDGIRAWVNVSGVIHGATGLSQGQSPKWAQQLDRAATSFKDFMRGWPSQMSSQLSAGNIRLRQATDWRELPFVCVSLFGFPNVGDVPLGQKGRFLNLAKLGPNDGACLFHDSIVKPGYVIPVPHMSHSAESMRLAPWMMATLRALKNSGRDQSWPA